MIFDIGDDKPEIHPTAFVHPSAEVSGKVRLGPNVSIWGGCILRGDIDWIEIGEDSNIQDGSVIHTSRGVPVTLGKGVTVGHKAVIHGATVRDYTLIGMGAILMDYSVVEENCLVGGAAAVVERGLIPKGKLAVGTPAKAIRDLKDSEVQMIVERASNYVKYARRYREALEKAKLI